jgi:acyl-CoA synthetase (NDP forming)
METVASLIAKARDVACTTGAWRLNEWEVFGILEAIGISHGPAGYLPKNASRDERRTLIEGFATLAGETGRMVVKVCGREILHKTEMGGVCVAKVDGPADVEAAIVRVEAAVKRRGLEGQHEGTLACGFVPHKPNQPGQEVLLGLRQDEAFGPVVVVGIGGTLTEWYGSRGTTVFPAAGLTKTAVIERLTCHPVLSILCRPSRLYPEAPVDGDALVVAVLALAELGVAFGPAAGAEFTIEEIEVNPAVPSGGCLVALDGVGLASTRVWAPVRRPLEKIRPLLAPRHAVVMGVSAKGANPGRIILDNLRRSPGELPRNLHVVHPTETEIDGVACVASCAELPHKCDLAVVSIPAEGALAAIGELVTTDMAESIILIPGGFAEAGETGLAAAIEQTLADGHAREGGGPIMVGGNCLGIVSRDHYNTFFLPLWKLPYRPGRGENLAIVSQSGAYLVTFASNYDGLIHPRASISFGNQMDLTVADFLLHFVDEPGVDVIACYVEGFRPGDGDRFVDAAHQAARRGKRVIVFKAGKTALGAKAAASHTASLAGDYAIARGCLEAAGVAVADTLDQFEDLIKTFTLLAGKEIRGRRVGILSNAGFECSTVTDALGDLQLAEFDMVTRAVLDDALPSFAHRDNPVDATPMAATTAYARASSAILACDGVDVAILSAVPVTPALETLEAVADGSHRENLHADASLGHRWAAIVGASRKPVVIVVDSGRLYDPLCRMLEEAGIPVFRKIDRAARALAAFIRTESCGHA